MPTAVNVAKQCLTAESAYALEESVNVARRRGHSQTTSLHAVSALLSLPTTSALRDACARVRNSAYSPRLQFKALDLCLSVSLDRIQSGQPGSDDDPPPISNSLMAAIKRSQAHQRRLPENFRMYQEMSLNQNSNSISCVKVEIRQLILSILDDPIVSRVFGEAGFRSSELKLSIIRPVPHLLRYSSPRGHHQQQQPLFLCNLTGNQPEPARWGFSVPNRNLTGDSDRHRIIEVLARDQGRNPVLVGVSAYSELTGFLNSLENRNEGILPVKLHGLTAVNIASEISDQITAKFDKSYIDSRFRDLGKLSEQGLGSGLVLNFGDLKVFTDGEGNEAAAAASYVVNRVTDLLRRSGRKVWLIGVTASYEIYEKTVRKFPTLEKDWDLQLLTITSLKAYHKSSLMGSFVPFGGFFSSPSDLKPPFSGFINQITEPVSSVSDQTQSTLPPWLQMTTRTDLDQKHTSKTKEGLDSVCCNKSTSSASASTGSAKSVTTDLNLRVSPVTTRLGLKKNVSSSCFDQPKDINAESFKIIYRRLTDRVSGQEEAARVISYALSQPPKSSTRRDVWLNLVGPDSVGKRRMSLVLAEIVYQSQHRFMAVDLGASDNGIGRGCSDDEIRLRGKTMVDHIFEVLCRNPFCVVFLENVEKADEKMQVSLSKAIETGKFMDSHGREVGIGNTMFVMTSFLQESLGTNTYCEERLLRAKDRQVEIRIETVSKFPSSMNKRKLMGLVASQETYESVKIGKRLNRAINKVLDLNLPAQETEETECLNHWIVKLKNQERLVEVSFKPFDFEDLALRIEKRVKEVFKNFLRLDCLLEIDTKIIERVLAAVYFSESREDMMKVLIEKVVARVFLKVKERYEITSSCVVKLVGRDLESSCNDDHIEMFHVK